LKGNRSIKLKAGFLLAVFALNTVVGFACSMGMDMGFSSKHHQDDESKDPTVHIQQDGKRHIHDGKNTEKSHHRNVSAKAAVHIHKDGRSHLHTGKKENRHQENLHHNAGEKNKEEQRSAKDNCCSEKVRNFEQLDKSLPQVVKIIPPAFLTAFVVSFYSIQLLPHTDVVKDIKKFVRSYHPPISDIRIAIQSFQI
jgi:hypothetical protein